MTGPASRLRRSLRGGAAGAVLLLPRLALAAVLEADVQTLTIAGEVSASQTSLAGILRITAKGAKEPIPLRLEARDLEGVAPSGEQRRLPAASLSIPQGVKVAADAPTDVRLVVSGLRDAASYGGEVRLVPEGKAKAAPLAVRLSVIAQTRPAATSSPPAVVLRVARCSPATCWLPRALGGTLAPGQDWRLQLNGSGDDVARVEAVQLHLVGERSGQASGGAITARPGVTPAGEAHGDLGKLGPGGTADVLLRVDPAALRADRYTGELVVALRGAPPSSLRSTVTTRAELLVRDGPVLPIVLLLLGIVLGRRARALETPTVQAQLRLLPQWRTVRAAAESLLDPRVKLALLFRLHRLNDAIQRGDGEAQVAADLQEVRRRIDVWQDAETWLAPLPAAEKAAIAAELEKLRAAVMDGPMADVDVAYRDFERKVRDLVTPAALASAAAPARRAGARGGPDPGRAVRSPRTEHELARDRREGGLPPRARAAGAHRAAVAVPERADLRRQRSRGLPGPPAVGARRRHRQRDAPEAPRPQGRLRSARRARSSAMAKAKRKTIGKAKTPARSRRPLAAGADAVRLALTEGSDSISTTGDVYRRAVPEDVLVQPDVVLRRTQAASLDLPAASYYYEFDVQYGSGAFTLAAKKGGAVLATRPYPAAQPSANTFDFVVP
jgi:hypothetical protein